MERPKERETLDRTLHKRPPWQFVCKPSLGSGHNQLKWKQRLHHLFPLRALLLHKSSDDEILREEILKEETPGYQVIPIYSQAEHDRDEDELAFDLGGVSHCSSALPWQPYETYLSGCLSSRLLFFCTCSAGNQVPDP